MPNTKECTICKQTKELTDFPKEKKMLDGHRHQCRVCLLARTNASRDKNRAKYNEYARLRRQDPVIRAKEHAYEKARYNDPTSGRKERCLRNKKKQHEAGYNLQYNYGITKEQRQQMVDSQNGCCAICGKHESVLKRGLFVDHCHATEENRGMLCDPCNKLLGHAEDNTEVLEKAIDYLKLHRKLKAV